MPSSEVSCFWFRFRLFLMEFAKDERSFKQDVFVATASILRNRISGVSEQEVLSFEG